VIKVECISCKNPYELDEKRLPASGLRMRCPKCGVSLLVFADGRVQAAPPPVAPPGAFGNAPRPIPSPGPVVPRPVVPPPDLGRVPLPATPARGALGRAALTDDLDLPASVSAPRPPTALGALELQPGAGSDADAFEELDLPALPKAALPKAALPKAALPAAGLDSDLPAPKAGPPAGLPAVSSRSAFGVAAPPAVPAPPEPPSPIDAGAAGELDLPALRGASAGPPLDLDLPAPLAKGAPAVAMDLDLPAPVAKRPGGPAGPSIDLPPLSGASPELELPDPLGARGAPDDLGPVDLPAVRGAPLELDLPAPLRGGARGLELDLPAPRGKAALAAPGTPFDDLDGADLSASRPGAVGSPLGGLDLPAPRGALDLPEPGFGALDLPAPRGAVDLPAPRDALDLPAPLGAVDLPQPSLGLDLPSPRSSVDLPSPVGNSELSLAPRLAAHAAVEASARASQIPSFDLPIPASGQSLPSMDSMPRTSLPSMPGAAPSFGGLELPLPEARPAAAAPGPAPRMHGEIELPGGEAALNAAGTEFSGLPSETSAVPPMALPLRPSGGGTTTKQPAAKTSKPARTAAFVVGGLVLLVLLGGALSFTPAGPFGSYFFERFLPGAGDDASVARVLAEADQLALADSYSSSTEALRVLAVERRTAGLNRTLLARSLLHECLHVLRWNDSGGAARAAAIRQRLEERGTDDPALALALAADELRSDHPDRALALVGRARAHAPSDPLVDLVEAEAALASEDAASALQAFQQALAHGGGARAQWGIARALENGGAAEALLEAVEATLALSPRHGDALLMRAQLAHARGNDDAAMADLRAVVGLDPIGEPPAPIVSPPALRGEAYALLGALHEDAGRLAQALEAYNAAVDADSTRADALLGAGRVLLVDRPAEALTRFESVMERPDASETMLASGRSAGQDARLGGARAMLDLDRDEEAKAVLENLVTERPEDPEFHLWLGRAHVALSESEEAEASYREAIRLAPESLDGYLFLARLYVSDDRDTDAVQALADARDHVPESASMREGLGTYELGLNRLPEAIAEFRRALAIDHALPAARFGLGVALRRSGAYDDALASFEELSRIDPGHPGLALERGLVFEQRGQSDRAVEFYAQALLQDPENPELLLRLGAAQVGAGDLDAASVTLARVTAALPTSAEAEHFIGRIAFARANYPEAVTHFERSIQLDASRGEFFVYRAWAALETGDLGRAREAAEAAISRDPSLSDAYWIRGAVRQRSGLVADALVDLNRALALNPDRTEALAEIGECEDQLRDLPAALDAYTRATAARPDNAFWWYRLGRLHMDADHAGPAAPALARATELGDAMAEAPVWLLDAHRLAGDALRLNRDRAGAIAHYQRYLALAPSGHVDMIHVRGALRDLGVTE
jgi:tetratricopeptide (TPR) repeat protein